MKFKDNLRESQAFLSRSIIAAMLVVVVLLMLVGRMVLLQIVDHEHYTTLSKDNRVKLVPLAPTRGLIYDSQGELLALNRPAYSLEMVPEQVDDIELVLQEIGQIIELSEDDIERFRKLKKRKRRFDSIPIRINLSAEEAAKFAVVRHQYPGVDVKAQLLRHYPHPEASAHVLGYVGRISKKDLEKVDKSNYSGSSHIGKIGIEKSYESALHGAVGVQQIEVNSVGRIARVLKHEPPLPGQDLHLYLDIKLQKIALDALEEHNGAVVAIDPNTGGILSMVSKPGYDPNLFVEGISRKNYKALQKDPRRPLYNRALRGQYPPGSTVKPFMALAGLETKQITYESSTYCPGFYQLPGHEHKYRGWKKTGHGAMDMDASVTQSCDIFFYKLAHDMGVDALSGYLDRFGFGKKTGVDLLGEARGILPSREWKRANRRQPWYPGETVIMGIGQGYFLTTPLQLAAATAAIANGGTFYTPHLVKTMKTRDGSATNPIPPSSKTITIEEQANWDDVHLAMTHVTEGLRGTAKRIRTEAYRIAGKTGTAQVFTVKQDEEYDADKISKKNHDHALFIAYAPIENPQIAIAVIVENGGHGGSTAAPIARKVMDAYLLPKLYPATNNL